MCRVGEAVKLIVTAPSGRPLAEGSTLITAARERFASAVRVQPSPPGCATDFHLYVTLDGDSLTVSHFADDASISVETSDLPLQEAVAWYRSLLPADFPRVIAFDQGWNGHVDLHHGITAQEVADRWVDHAVDGWNTGDPDFA